MSWQNLLVEEPVYFTEDDERTPAPYNWFRGRLNPSVSALNRLLWEADVIIGRQLHAVGDLMSEDGTLALLSSERGATVVANDIAPWFEWVMGGYKTAWVSGLYKELETFHKHANSACRYLRIHYAPRYIPENWLRPVLSCNAALKDLIMLGAQGLGFWRLQMLSFFAHRYPYIRADVRGDLVPPLYPIDGLAPEALLDMFFSYVLQNLDTLRTWAQAGYGERIQVTTRNVRGLLGDIGPFDLIYVSLPYWHQLRPALLHRVRMRVIGKPLDAMQEFDAAHFRNWRIKARLMKTTGTYNYYRILPAPVYPTWLEEPEEIGTSAWRMHRRKVLSVSLTCYIEDIYIMLSNFRRLLRPDGLVAIHSYYQPMETYSYFLPLPEVLENISYHAGYDLVRGYHGKAPMGHDIEGLVVFLRLSERPPII